MPQIDIRIAYQTLVKVNQNLKSPSVDWKKISEGITQVGMYLETTILSDVDVQFLIEIEYFLNETYLLLKNEFITHQLYEITVQSLALASAVAFSVKTKKFDPQFFSSLKQLGEKLIQISSIISDHSLGETRLAGDETTDAPPPDVDKKNKKKKGK